MQNLPYISNITSYIRNVAALVTKRADVKWKYRWFLDKMPRFVTKAATTFCSYFLFLPLTLLAEPYPPEAGSEGSTAIHYADPSITSWAEWITGGPHIGANSTDPNYHIPEYIIGPVTSDPSRVFSLGDGGWVTLGFPTPIRDGEGYDFAVFENSFNNWFLELGYVEVSSDGVNFVRFPVYSETLLPVPFVGGMVNPRNIDGFAGKYRRGYGTPFDLATLRDLSVSAHLDFERIHYIRIVDVIGDGRDFDELGRPIYDPHPTPVTAGFDLDGIGALNTGVQTVPTLNIQQNSTTENWLLIWQGIPGFPYQLEYSTDLSDWHVIPESKATGSGEWITAETNRFYRIVRAW